MDNSDLEAEVEELGRRITALERETEDLERERDEETDRANGAEQDKEEIDEEFDGYRRKATEKEKKYEMAIEKIFYIANNIKNQEILDILAPYTKEKVKGMLLED